MGIYCACRMIVVSVLFAGVGILVWLGLGLSSLLPPMLRRWAPLLAPTLGYVLLVLVGYACVQSIFDLRAALGFSVVIASLLNVLLWRRWSAAWWTAAWGEVFFVAGLALATYALGALMLLPLGRSLPVGWNWDNEIYLPLADLLRHMPLPRIKHEPANPLVQVIGNPQRAALSVGFSILHGTLGLLVRRAALETMYPALCLLRALSVVGYAVLFRSAFHLRPAWAVFGAALTAAFGLSFWIVLFGFGMQAAAMPLLPLGLTLLVVALRDGGWRAVGLAGATFAAMPMIYYPLVVSFLPLAVPLGLALFFLASDKRRFVLTTLKLALVTFGLGFWTIVDWGRGFAFTYSVQSQSAGVSTFISWQQAFGLLPFALEGGNPALPPWLTRLALVAMPAALLAVLLVACALWRGRERLLWLGMAGGALAYLLFMRYISGGSGYPYGFLKASATVVVPLLGLIAAGGQALHDRLPRRRVVAPLLVAPVAFSVALAAFGTAAPYWSDKPLLYRQGALDARELLRELPPGASVLFSRDTRLAGPDAGLLSYYALGHRLLDGTRTGFSTFPSNPNGELGDFALLHADEDPTLYGYAPTEQVGKTELVALYRRQMGLTAQGVPPRPVLAAGSSMIWSAGADGLHWEGTAAGGGDYRLGLQLANVAPAEFSIILNGASQNVSLPAGVSEWWSEALPAPIQVEVRDPSESMLVRTVMVAQPDYPALTGLQPAAPQAVIDPRLTVNEQTLVITATVLTPERITLSLDIWDTARGLHWGWFGLEVPPGASAQQVEWTIDLTQNMSQAQLNKQPLLVAQQAAGRADGNYTAALGVSIANRSLIDPVKAFSFQARGGSATAPAAWTRGLFSVPVWQPATPLQVTIGDDVRLLGYTLPATAKPGESLPLTLYWQAMAAPGEERSVLVHLQDATGAMVAQADGPPAGGARPVSTWQRGDYIRDDRTVALPPSLAPGNYNLAIGMYRFPSIERLPLRQGGEPLPDDVIHIPLTLLP